MNFALDQLKTVAPRGFSTTVIVTTAGVTQNLIVAKQTTPSDMPVMYTIYVQKLRIVVRTGAAQTWTIQDSAGSPVILVSAQDMSVAGIEFEWDFGPVGRAITVNKDLVLSISAAGAAGDVYIEGYQDPLEAANNGIPAFVSISPATGAQAGGTAVAIFGTGFRRGATVAIGGVACTSVQWIAPQELLCVTGAHAAGAVNVVVTNPAPNGSEVATGAGAFTYV